MPDALSPCPSARSSVRSSTPVMIHAKNTIHIFRGCLLIHTLIHYFQRNHKFRKCISNSIALANANVCVRLFVRSSTPVKIHMKNTTNIFRGCSLRVLIHSFQRIHRFRKRNPIPFGRFKQVAPFNVWNTSK